MDIASRKLLTKSTRRYLLVQSQQWKHQSNMWNLFYGNNKDTRTTQWRRCGVFSVTFEQIPHIIVVFLLLTLNK